MRQKPRDGAVAPGPENHPVSALRVEEGNPLPKTLATCDGKDRYRWPADGLIYPDPERRVNPLCRHIMPSNRFTVPTVYGSTLTGRRWAG